MAIGLGLLWVGISLSYLATDDVPQPIVDSGHPTGVVFAVDLVFIVPPMLLAAIWLIRRRTPGWVLAGVMSVGGSIYTLTLAAAVCWHPPTWRNRDLTGSPDGDKVASLADNRMSIVC